MCLLARVSRAGFYRFLKEHLPREEDTEAEFIDCSTTTNDCIPPLVTGPLARRDVARPGLCLRRMSISHFSRTLPCIPPTASIQRQRRLGLSGDHSPRPLSPAASTSAEAEVRERLHSREGKPPGRPETRLLANCSRSSLHRPMAESGILRRMHPSIRPKFD
jgi:hypothetical protein